MSRLLLHICCAPDASVPWPELSAEGWDAAGYFYGGNIHPREEWERRRDAAHALSDHLGLPLIIEPYDTDEWARETAPFRDSPEGGERCAVCFRLQLAAAARRAAEGSFDALCTTLTISPHKDPSLINKIGREEAAARGLEWVERVWRKNGGFKRSVAASRELGLYRQNYCGCGCSARVSAG